MIFGRTLAPGLSLMRRIRLAAKLVLLALLLMTLPVLMLADYFLTELAQA